MKVDCRALVTSLAVALCLLPVTVTAESNPVAQGKQLYQKGERANDNPLTAYVGRAAIAMDASTLPCMGCHGRDGKGRPEGGVIPSNITWQELTKVYGGTSKSGRQFGTYTEDAFLKAVTEGVDPEGNKLDASMPRYNISRHDARKLISYLKIIENEYDPGISDKKIVFASLQPSEGWQAKLGEVLTSTIDAYFSDINEQGGVYGRKLKLETLTYDGVEGFTSQVEQVTVSDKYFATLVSLSGNADNVLIEASEQAQMISIAPFTNNPAVKGSDHRYSFYIYGGMQTQSQALLKRMTTTATKKDQLLVFYKQDGPYQEDAKQVEQLLKQQGFKRAQVLPYSIDKQDWQSKLNASNKQQAYILFLGGSDELVSAYAQLQKTYQLKRIYLPGMLVNRKLLELPKEAMQKLEISYHSVPDKEGKLEDFYKFLHKHKFGAKNMSIRLFAYSGARIALEGVKRAGKRVSREKVVDAIEKLFDFDAGLNRPVRFDSSRRIALKGAYIVRYDSQQNRLASTGDWVALD